MLPAYNTVLVLDFSPAEQLTIGRSDPSKVMWACKLLPDIIAEQLLSGGVYENVAREPEEIEGLRIEGEIYFHRPDSTNMPPLLKVRVNFVDNLTTQPIGGIDVVAGANWRYGSSYDSHFKEAARLVAEAIKGAPKSTGVSAEP